MAEIPTQSLAESSGDVTGQVVRSQDPIADVAKLLSQAPAPAEPTPETEPQAEPTSESWDLKSVAERLKTDPAKLYEGLKVALDDGTELTVSALKDAHRPIAELEKARGALLEEHTSSKREVLEATQELEMVLRAVPQQYLSQEAVAEARRQAGQQREREAEKLLARIPEWKDPISKAADWVDIRRVALESGYTEAEIALAKEGYSDHRMVALMRRLARGPAAEAVKPAPKVGVKPAGKGQSPAQMHGNLKAAVKRGQISPFSAVERLIGGK